MAVDSVPSPSPCDSTRTSRTGSVRELRETLWSGSRSTLASPAHRSPSQRDGSRGSLVPEPVFRGRRPSARHRLERAPPLSCASSLSLRVPYHRPRGRPAVALRAGSPGSFCPRPVRPSCDACSACYLPFHCLKPVIRRVMTVRSMPNPTMVRRPRDGGYRWERRYLQIARSVESALPFRRRTRRHVAGNAQPDGVTPCNAHVDGARTAISLSSPSNWTVSSCSSPIGSVTVTSALAAPSIGAGEPRSAGRRTPRTNGSVSS